MCGNCHRFENQINMPDDPIRNYQLMEEQEIAPSGFEGIA